MTWSSLLAPTAAGLAVIVATVATAKPRAREYRIPFEGTPGTLNAITDVAGVEVGHTTLIKGAGKLVIGVGPVRTGVTAILPRGKNDSSPVFAAWHSLNGNGEMTGTTWLEDSGLLDGPVVTTNTHSIGAAHQAVVSWRVKQGKPNEAISLPVVAETWDGFLNDINGFHVKEEHVLAALDSAKSGPVAEGGVGGGTGMVCYEFKGGIGTASRSVQIPAGTYIVGVLVQANYGLRNQLKIAGIPVGQAFPSDLVWSKETGSILVVVATDAPLLPHQLKRMARRAGMGIARLGSVSGDSSGDIFIAFSTQKTQPIGDAKNGVNAATMLKNDQLDKLFEATIQAVEESVVNALVAAETMTGVDDHRAVAMPVKDVVSILKKHGRLADPLPSSH